MGILDSLISLAVVVGAGYVAITYVIPKIQGGEFGLPGAESGGGKRNRKRDESSLIMSDIANTADIPKKPKKPKVPGAGGAAAKGAKGAGAAKGGAAAKGAKGGAAAKGTKAKAEEKKKKVKKELIYAYLDGEF